MVHAVVGEYHSPWLVPGIGSYKTAGMEKRANNIDELVSVPEPLEDEDVAEAVNEWTLETALLFFLEKRGHSFSRELPLDMNIARYLHPKAGTSSPAFSPDIKIDCHVNGQHVSLEDLSSINAGSYFRLREEDTYEIRFKLISQKI